MAHRAICHPESCAKGTSVNVSHNTDATCLVRNCRSTVMATAAKTDASFLTDVKMLRAFARTLIKDGKGTPTDQGDQGKTILADDKDHASDRYDLLVAHERTPVLK
jgi:hypothetical protein